MQRVVARASVTSNLSSWTCGGRGAMSDQLKNGAANPPQPPAAVSAPTRHRHRILVGTLFVLATVIGIVAVLAVWTNRQALNTDNWTDTSSQVLADEHVQNALAAYTVNQLFGRGGVEAQVEAAVPAEVQGVAGPETGGPQQVGGQAAPKVLPSPQVQDAGKTANHAAHATFMKIIE